jgi:hypothetical protein
MPSWKKLLASMVADPKPRSYTYEDAASVLSHLGFELANPKPRGSHRLWRISIEKAHEKRTVYVGLVEAGSGNLKPIYVTKMVRILQENDLLPSED